MSLRESLSVVLRREHLRKTLTIALIVGCVVTTIDRLGVFLSGDATEQTFAKTGLNLCVPFVVSNLGPLGGRRAEAEGATADEVGRESGVRWAPAGPRDT